MAAKLLPKWEGHPEGKHQPAKDLCMSNSSSGQVRQPGGFVCLSQQPSKCRGPQESSLEPPWPCKVLVLGMLEVEKWDGGSWGSSSSSVEQIQTGRVMFYGGSPALCLLTAPQPLCPGYFSLVLMGCAEKPQTVKQKKICKKIPSFRQNHLFF